MSGSAASASAAATGARARLTGGLIPRAKHTEEAVRFPRTASFLWPSLSRFSLNFEQQWDYRRLAEAELDSVPAKAQRQMAQRAGARVTETPGSHAVYVSHPGEVAKAVEQAALAPVE